MLDAAATLVLLSVCSRSRPAALSRGGARGGVLGSAAVDDEEDRNSGHTPFTPRAPGFNFTASASRFGGGAAPAAAPPPADLLPAGWWAGAQPANGPPGGGGGGAGPMPGAAALDTFHGVVPQAIRLRGNGVDPGAALGSPLQVGGSPLQPAAAPPVLASAVTFDPNGLDASSGRFACAAAEAAAAEAAAAEAAAVAEAASGLRQPTANQTTSTESAAPGGACHK